MALDCVVRISLNGITRMERTHVPRKGHCLLLDVAGTRYIFAFRSDNDLYTWHDSIYSVSPLTLFKASENTAEVDLENIISGYSLDSASTGTQFSTAASKPQSNQLIRSSTNSPGSSRTLLVDEDPFQSSVSLHAHSHSHSHSYSVSSSGPSTHTRSTSHPTTHATPKPPLPLRSTERQLLRDAVGLLCDIMEPRLLRKSDPGGEKPVDLVEMRLRPLARIRRRWGRQPAFDIKNTVNADPAAEDEEEMRIFTEALRDGYVLCQLLNTLNGNTVVRPDDRAASGSNLNITKFLAAAAKLAGNDGTPQPVLFLPLDLVEATGYSLARVAKSIIALVKANSATEIRAKSPTPSTTSTSSSPTPAKAASRAATPVLSIADRAYAELVEWQTAFEAQTRERMVTCAKVDAEEELIEEEPEFPDSKVYQHLISFVAQAKPAEDTQSVSYQCVSSAFPN
ncbi:hypothetical protein C8F01DRAFT_707163 [Mycena amicta]|nr:hypothetical protein C8F01DRAFT_707163 [Mycena amicta]